MAGWRGGGRRAASSSRTASRPGSQRVEMGWGVGPFDAFSPSWPLRTGTVRDPIPNLMQPWGVFLVNLILASPVIKRKREAEKGREGLLNGCLVLENMRRDGEFVTSCWLWNMNTKRRINR